MASVSWLTQGAADLPSGLDWLGPEEQQVLAGLRFEKRRMDWLLGRWTAKLALRRVWQEALAWPDLQVIAAEDGAPEPYRLGRRLPLSLSLSHSQGKGFCVIQFSGLPVGADVEKIEARSMDFVLDYFLPSEIHTVMEAPAEEQPLLATLIWSAKESALKVKREGLRLDTRGVEVHFEGKSEAGEWEKLRVNEAATGKEWTGRWRTEAAWVYTVLVDAPDIYLNAL